MPPATDINRFAIRVYAFVTNPNGQVLLSFEEYNGAAFIKFPGGGLEYGENIPEGLLRELQEELDITTSAKKLQHVYTCDFLVINQFNPQDQVIGVYYELALSDIETEKVNAILNITKRDGQMTHVKKKWVNPLDIKNRLTFPMDRKAVDIYLKR